MVPWAHLHSRGNLCRFLPCQQILAHMWLGYPHCTYNSSPFSMTSEEVICFLSWSSSHIMYCLRSSVAASSVLVADQPIQEFAGRKQTAAICYYSFVKRSIWNRAVRSLRHWPLGYSCTIDLHIPTDDRAVNWVGHHKETPFHHLNVVTSDTMVTSFLLSTVSPFFCCLSDISLSRHSAVAWMHGCMVMDCAKLRDPECPYARESHCTLECLCS